jgi:nitrogen fixation NifU-like protein
MFHNKLLRCFIRNKYSKVLVNHFEKPQNVGSFDKTLKNIGTAIVGAPACGDVMKLQIKVNPLTNIIEDAKFKTFGCGSAIASSSYATQYIKNMKLEDARNVNNATIAKHLKLPPVKLHCSMLAEDAIKMAISDYLKNNNKKNI